MISITSKGSWDNTDKFLKQMVTDEYITSQLDAAGRAGVRALASATPADTGVSANSWSYEIIKGKKSWTLVWKNSHTAAGVPVVILLQYGHGTGTGGYVRGRDFINPAIQPIFDEISQSVWKAVTTA